MFVTGGAPGDVGDGATTAPRTPLAPGALGGRRDGGLSVRRRRELATGFADLVATVPDPSTPGAAMAEWLRSWATLTASLDGLLLGATAAFADSVAWAADGARTPVSWLVGNTGESRAAMGALVKTARSVRSMEHVHAAALDGRLCREKVRLLTRARADDVAELFDAEEASLVEEAVERTVDSLRVHLGLWRMRALEELGRNERDGKPPLPETEADRINLRSGHAGWGLIDGELSPESRDLLERAVGTRFDAWHRDGLLVDDERSLGERTAAAILELVEQGSLDTVEHGHARPLVIALADWDTLTDLERRRIREHLEGLDATERERAGAAGSAAEPEAEPDAAGGEPEADESVPEAGEPDREGAEPGDPGERDEDGTDEPGPQPRPAEGAVPDVGEPARATGEADPEAVESEPEPVHAGSLAVRRRCEVLGGGPLPLSALERLLARDAEVVRVVLGPDGRPIEVGASVRAGPPGLAGLTERLQAAPSMALDLGRGKRTASWPQWLALQVRSRGACEVPGCGAPARRCHAHHRRRWEQGGGTDLHNLQLVCHHDHHHTIHQRGFDLEPIDGTPRHQLRRPDGTPVEVPFDSVR